MKDCYEYRKNRIRYAFLCGILLLVSCGCVLSVTLCFDTRFWFIFGILFLVISVFYIIMCSDNKKLYLEIRNISNIMVDIVENPDTVSEEKYLQGELGILYTNLYKLVGTLRESKLKEQEEKIFLRDIISDISHQLKTPLASLTVFMDLLYENRLSDNSKRQQVLSEAKNQLTRMEWMVLSMLKLARIEAGAIEFEKRNSNLYEILVQVAEGVRYLTEARKQTVQINCNKDAYIVCDADWLVEALINLLKNASDYSGENSVIKLYVEQNSMYTRIFVEDNGIGISESELSHIFERFYRVNCEVNPNSVGIGLSLTKSIVEGMGGKIYVRSELGKYTRFILTFMK